MANIKRHWAIYYIQRKSLVSDSILSDEIARKLLPESCRHSLSDMLATARALAPANASHFAIGKANDAGQRRAQQLITEELPCR